MSNAGWPSRRQVVAGAGAIAAGVMTTAHAASPLPMAHGYVFHDHRNTKRWKQGDRGIANVLVSNGVEVVRTDADGRWQLPAPPVSEVFVIKPPGWSLPRGPLGLTSFSQCVTAAIGNSAEIAEANSSSSIDFALQAADEKGAFVVALVADTQPQSDLELFRSRLENIIDMAHPMVLLAQRIDWDALGASFGKFFTEKGRPALPTRLLVGLHLIKHMEGLSDEAVCAAWVQNQGNRFGLTPRVE